MASLVAHREITTSTCCSGIGTPETADAAITNAAEAFLRDTSGATQHAVKFKPLWCMDFVRALVPIEPCVVAICLQLQLSFFDFEPPLPRPQFSSCHRGFTVSLFPAFPFAYISRYHVKYASSVSGFE